MAQDPRALLQQAEKQLKSAGGGFSFFGGREDKYESAAQLFTQAGNAFRLQSQFRDGGRALERAAAVQRDNLKEEMDSARTWMEAAKCYRQGGDFQDAAKVQGLAVAYYTGQGNFRQGATQQVVLADIVEQLGDKRKTAELLQQAAQWFEGDNATAIGNKHLERAAGILAEMEDYQGAIAIYEKVAKDSVSSNLMKFSTKKFLFKAEICYLVQGDTVATARAIQQHLGMLPNYQQDAEFHLVNDVQHMMEDPSPNPDDFGARLEAHNRIYRLDDWEVMMFLRIRKRIEGEGEDFS